MRRPVPAILLALALLAGCAPGGDAPAGSPATAPAPSPVAVATRGSTVTLAPARPAPSPAASPAEAAPPVPTAAPSPTAGPAAVPASPSGRPDRRQRDRPYAISLASEADFVRQHTFEWCVGASIQMTRSIVTGERNESRRSQRRLWELAREHTIDSPYGGANPAGWAAALNELGLGPYRLVSLPTFEEAVHRASEALVTTRRPVGLVMWAGRHAWVMTGFEATANPRRHPDAEITGIRVMDPLYPHGSRWGPSPAPNRLVSLDTLARQFVSRDRPDYDFGVDPGWLLVLPVT